MSMRDIKICLLGESGVGKSSIVMRFVTNTFKSALESTIGASFMTKTIVVDGDTFKFQIWDTAGQEKYRALAPMYYRGSAAAIIVYDVTREASFHAVKGWVHELQRHGASKIVIGIAGNKCDLDDLREVRERDAQEYALDIGAIFCETSAMTAQNVPELFDAIDAQEYALDIGAIFCETSAMTAQNVPELFDAIARLLPPEDNGSSISSQTGSNTVTLRNSTSKKRNRCCSNSTADDEALSTQVSRRSEAVPRVAGYRSVSFQS